MFCHLCLVLVFASQQATDKTVLQPQGFQALVANALGQQTTNLIDHPLAQALIDALIDAAIEFRPRPVNTQQKALVEWSRYPLLLGEGPACEKADLQSTDHSTWVAAVDASRGAWI